MKKSAKHPSADDRLQVVLNRLDDPGSNNISFDTETSGLDWRKNHIVGYVVTFSSDPRDSYYVPFRHAGGGNVGDNFGPQLPDAWNGKPARGELDLTSRLFRRNRTLVGHHVAFDLKFSYRVAGDAVFEPQYQDTMINDPLINEFAGKFSLSACCLRHGVQAKKGEAIYEYLRSKFPEIKETGPRTMEHFWRLAGDDAMAVEYAAGDGTSTWQLRGAQMVEICKPFEIRAGLTTTLEKVHDIESRLIRVLARMTCRGIQVDVGYFEKLHDDLNRQIRDMMQDFPDPDNASVQAASDVKWYMEKHGVTNWPMTPKTKKPSFPESWLQQSEPGRKIIAIRHVVHMRNSFIRPLLEEHIWNGRVHANFNQLKNDDYGTIIGRLSCDSPNLQQAHKRDEVRGRMLRSGFLPDDGMLFGEADYKQCEPSLLAHYSRCKVLFDGYNNDPNFDCHTGVTRAMNLSKGYDDWDAKQKKAAREFGKRINQTLITGGGQGVIVEKYGVDPAEVAQKYREYFAAMPEIKVTQKNMERAFKRRGYMVTLLGRRLHLPRPDLSYVALNRILSGGNADVLKSKMVEIDDYLESQGRPPVHLLNNIHDALDFQFDPTYREVYNTCLDIMTRFGPNDLIPLDVPLRVDTGEGKTWAEATFGEEK